VSYVRIRRCSEGENTIALPCGRVKEAQALFRCFHNFPAPELIKMPCRRLIPKVLMKLGHLRGVIYSSDKGQPGCPQTYVHFMERPPLLACDPQGTQLYIIGGGYRVTSKGIEG